MLIYMVKTEKKFHDVRFLFVLFCLLAVTSCVTAPRTPQQPPVITPEIEEEPPAPVQPSIYIAGTGTRSEEQLVTFFMANNPAADRAKVERMAGYYVRECAIEGINSDVAFVQMCLETGFLRFGGLVTEDMNNFCGLGAIDAEHPGNAFATEELGVRAHVQHLHAYGSTADLVQECIDNRYKWVTPRGKAPTIYELAGTWAADRQYGEKLAVLLERLGQL